MVIVEESGDILELINLVLKRRSRSAKFEHKPLKKIIEFFKDRVISCKGSENFKDLFTKVCAANNVDLKFTICVTLLLIHCPSLSPPLKPEKITI